MLLLFFVAVSFLIFHITCMSDNNVTFAVNTMTQTKFSYELCVCLRYFSFRKKRIY